MRADLASVVSKGLDQLMVLVTARFGDTSKHIVKGLCILFSGYYISTECRGKQSLTYRMLIGSEQNA